jgi:S1-C subfamily serine protease
MENDCNVDCSSFIVVQADLGAVQYAAKLVDRDKNRDLAVLEIVSNNKVKTHPAAFVDVAIPWGRSCCTFGHPLSAVDQTTGSMRIPSRATSGIVSMPYNAERFPGTTPVNLYEPDFFAHGGASGGPVFLRTGEVFAVVSGSQLVDHGSGQPTRSNLAIGIDSREAIAFLKGVNINPQIRRGVR